LYRPRLPAYTVYLVINGAGAFFMTLFGFISALYRVQTAGLSPLELLLLGAALEGSVLLFEVPTGVVADVYSRRLSIVIGHVIIGAGILLESALAWFPTMFVAQAIWGLGYTFTSGATDAWLADELGEENLAGIYLRGSQLGRVGGIAGVLVGTAIGLVSFRLSIALGGAGMVLLAGFLALFMPETGFAPTPRPERNTYGKMVDTFRDGLAVVRKRRVLWLIVGITAVYGLASEGMDRLEEAHFLRSFSFPTIVDWPPVVWFALLTLASSFLGLAVAEWMRRRATIETRPTLLRLMLLTNIPAIGSVIIFGLVVDIWLAFAAVLSYRIMRGAGGPLLSAWTNKEVGRQSRATVLSMMGQMDAVGQLVGGPVIGLVATVTSLRGGIVGTGLLLTPVLVLLVAGLWRERVDSG
jgi:DHA3 family tetracycline resistance protein-like MFS transporter